MATQQKKRSSLWSRFMQARKEKHKLSKRLSTTFVHTFTTDENYLIVLSGEVYRVAIDQSSVNIIDINGDPVSDSDLVVNILGKVYKGR